MNVMTYQGQTEVIAIGLGPGEMLLESVIKTIQDHDIRNGVVVSVVSRTFCKIPRSLGFVF